MKKQAYMMIAMVVLFGCMAISARAQCLSRTQSSAKIPFQFSTGERSLPAGEYTVECLIPEQGMLAIRSADRKASVILLMIPAAADAEGRGRLVFHRYGNQYFLAQAWIGGTETGLELPKSRAERLAERELAPVVAKRDEIVLTRR